MCLGNKNRKNTFANILPLVHRATVLYTNVFTFLVFTASTLYTTMNSSSKFKLMNINAFPVVIGNKLFDFHFICGIT